MLHELYIDEMFLLVTLKMQSYEAREKNRKKNCKFKKTSFTMVPNNAFERKIQQ